MATAMGKYIDLTPGCITLAKPKRDKLDFASECLGRRLYGDRHPIETMHGKSPLARCRAMFKACSPHFAGELPGCMQVVQVHPAQDPPRQPRLGLVRGPVALLPRCG